MYILLLEVFNLQACLQCKRYRKLLEVGKLVRWHHDAQAHVGLHRGFPEAVPIGIQLQMLERLQLPFRFLLLISPSKFFL